MAQATIAVSSVSELHGALQNASAGTTILLAPGDYGRVMVTNFNPSQAVTLKSANSGNPASFEQLIVRYSSNLTIDSVHFENKGFFAPGSGNISSNGGIKYLELLRTDASSNLVIQDSTFVGATIPSGHFMSGYAHGIGWRGMGIDNVTFTGNTMTNVWKGMTLKNTDGVDITHNSISDYRSDALFIDTAKNLKIDGNSMTDVYAYQVKGGGDHADFIQIKNVVNGIITNNYMDVGSSHSGSQGIFSGYAANMDVSNNILISRMGNGISFNQLIDSNISSNLLLKADDPAGGLTWADGSPRKVGGPQIRVSDKYNNVVVEDNISHDYSLNLGYLVSTGKISAINNIQVANNQVDSGMLAKAGIDLSKFASGINLTVTTGSNGGQVVDPVTAPGGSGSGQSPPPTSGGAVLHGSSGNDTLRGGEGNDMLFGGTGNDSLFGGAGDDLLDGHFADDKLYDVLGDNIFDGGGGNDRIEAGAGDDVFLFRGTERGDSTITGFGNGNDEVHLIGTKFNDFDDVLSAGRNTSSGWRLDIDNDTSVTFLGVDQSQLVSENFIIL